MNIGRNGIAAFDLTAGCAGFGYGLAVATNMIRGGGARYVVVVGVERMSDGIDPTDRNTAFIFGDGAGAVVVGPRTRATTWARSSGVRTASRPAPSLRPELARVHGRGRRRRSVQPHLVMDGSKVFRWAAVQVSMCATLEATDVTAEQIQAFIPHQANSRINAAMAKHLGLPDTVAIAGDIEQTGNTSAASIPLAMETMLREGSARTSRCASVSARACPRGQVVRLPARPPVD